MARREAPLPAELLSDRQPVVPVILGPTGSGKTQVAMALALELDGEVVVADSRQVYAGFDIGSNKPTAEDRSRVRFHLVDFVDPRTVYNAFQFVQDATRAILDIHSRGRLAIVEGATMLYVRALTQGFNLAAVPPRPDLRARLDELSTPALVARLRRSDPDAAVDPQNRVRLVRAVEVVESTGRSLVELRRREGPRFRFLKIGLRLDLARLDDRLRVRTAHQLERGLASEPGEGRERGVPDSAPVMSGVGAGDVRRMEAGEFPPAELADEVWKSNRRLARRQLRWLHADPEVHWFDAESDPVPDIVNLVRSESS